MPKYMQLQLRYLLDIYFFFIYIFPCVLISCFEYEVQRGRKLLQKENYAFSLFGISGCVPKSIVLRNTNKVASLYIRKPKVEFSYLNLCSATFFPQ